MNITEALLEDETGQVQIVWFNQPFIIKISVLAIKYLFLGKLKKDLLGYSFVSPCL